MRYGLAVALVGAATVGGWGEDSRAALSAGVRPSAPDPTPRMCSPGERPLGSHGSSYAAMATRALVARTRPGGTRLAALGRRNANGFPTVFAVRGEVVGRDCRARWYRVQLPIRPNGAAGYVDARSVELFRVRTRVEVDLSERRIRVFRDGRQVLTTTTAVGAPGTPTPTGRYYVNQLLLASDPDGAFGPGGVGISAFSPVLTGWVQGGPIAIHGTNQPDSIGRAVSFGCLRVANAVVRWLFREVPAGTPVVIRS